MMQKDSMLHSVSLILLILGGLNWLLIGLFDWGVESLLGGADSLLARALFILIGLAAVYEITSHKHRCKTCSVKDSAPAPMSTPEGS